MSGRGSCKWQQARLQLATSALLCLAATTTTKSLPQIPRTAMWRLLTLRQQAPGMTITRLGHLNQMERGPLRSLCGGLCTKQQQLWHHFGSWRNSVSTCRCR
jgi:hypothetical protein